MTHEEHTAVSREAVVVPGGTRGWLGHAFPAREEQDPTIYAPQVLGSPPSPGWGELCYNPGECWLNGPGEQIPGVQLVWAQIPTLPGGVRVGTEVPSLMPGRHPHPRLTGPSGAEHIPGYPGKAPVSSPGTANFPSFEVVKFHGLRNVFFTDPNQDT